MMRVICLSVCFFVWTETLAQCVSGDCQSGYGTFKYSDGAEYVGEFKDGLAHGQGTCYYKGGAKYIGEFRNHKFNGRGTMYYADGTKKSCEWKDNEPVSGTEYTVGCLSGDCFIGKGVYSYDNGTRYEGDFANGLIEGQGTCDFSNGDKYTGTWKNHKMDGEGLYVYADGTRKQGVWKEGTYVGAITATRGCVSGNCDNGFGIYVYNDGSRYVGDFRNAKPEGKGTLAWSDGNKYIGEWKTGLAHGYGTMYYKDGQVVTGYFENNQKVEKVVENPTPKIWAVIVGVALYHHINSLRYTKDDAYRMYAFLKSPEGGALPDNQIRLLVDDDATRKNVIRDLKEMLGQAGRDDLVLFYFSGHGMKGAFLPFDFDGQSNYLFHQEIGEVLKNSIAKYKVCIADACHSGSLQARERSGASLDAFYEVLKKSTGGTALIMSSKAEETSIEFNNFRQGVFTYYLIRGLKGSADDDGDKIVTIKELFDYVQQEVRNYTSYQQNPVMTGTYDPGMPLGFVR